MIQYFKSKESQNLLRQDIEFTVASFLSDLPDGPQKPELAELLINTAIDWAKKKGYDRPVSDNTQED